MSNEPNWAENILTVPTSWMRDGAPHLRTKRVVDSKVIVDSVYRVDCLRPSGLGWLRLRRPDGRPKRDTSCVPGGGNSVKEGSVRLRGRDRVHVGMSGDGGGWREEMFDEESVYIPVCQRERERVGD